MQAFLVLAAPFVVRAIFVYLGMGLLTFVGYQVAVNTLLTAVENGYSSLGSDVLSYLALAGVNTGFGYILAAVSIRVGALLAPKLTWDAVTPE